MTKTILKPTENDCRKDRIYRAFKGNFSKTLRAQSMIKMLEKLEIVEVDEVDTSALNLIFQPAPGSGNYPVIIENVTKPMMKIRYLKTSLYP